ncbi:hypothetical protein BDZ89DRAFT_241422 [Hymenopellis radicata]|nr:hypothetical protein BDZ89DRAFT_241422 [Hymenopellis radicata]
MFSFPLMARFGCAPAAAPTDTFRGAFWCSSSRRHQFNKDSGACKPSQARQQYYWIIYSCVDCGLGSAPTAAWTAVQLDISADCCSSSRRWNPGWRASGTRLSSTAPTPHRRHCRHAVSPLTIIPFILPHQTYFLPSSPLPRPVPMSCPFPVVQQQGGH